MSEQFHRAIDDLDGRAPGGFQDARLRLLDEVRHGADARQLVQAVNQTEMQPGHAGAQIRLTTDRQGYLDIAPANYGGNQGRYDVPPPQYQPQYPPQYQPQYPPAYEAPPPQTYYPQPNPGAALGAGIIGGLIGGAISGAIAPRRRY